jgi:hypothetical protein
MISVLKVRGFHMTTHCSSPAFAPAPSALPFGALGLGIACPLGALGLSALATPPPLVVGVARSDVAAVLLVDSGFVPDFKD